MTNPNKQNNNPEKEPASSRRSLLTKLWVLLGIVALAELIGIVFAFLKPNPKKSSAADRAAIIVAGPADNFQPGTVTAFVRGKFYLARLEDGGFLALSRSCTHLGCTVPWSEEEKKFICPCHASAFDISGNVINAPAPRALDLFPVVIENNRVIVDTGRRVKRTSFRKNQAAYIAE